MLLYRTLGHQTIGEMVPVGDHELYSWIMRVHGLHLEPLLVSGGLDASAVGAYGGARMLGSAGVVAGTGGSVGVRAFGGAGSVGASANVRAGAARVLGGGASAGLVARPAAGLMAGSVTDDLFNVVDRNHDG